MELNLSEIDESHKIDTLILQGIIKEQVIAASE